MLKLIKGLGVLLLALALLGASPIATQAKPICAKVNARTGECTIWIDDGEDNVPIVHPVNGDDDHQGEPTCTYRDRKVPCSSGFGGWSQPHQCYATPATPQPPKSDPVWGGHDDGAVYACYNPFHEAPSPDPIGSITYIWLPKPPLAVDPEVLARRAMATMGLRAIQVGLSVKDLPDRMIYVGAPVWMWTANPGVETLGPNTASASGGGITVTATARVEAIDWDMGDGGRVHCPGERRTRGTIYRRAFGVVDSPTCGYRYSQPAAQATITATSHWVVDWAGGGQSGTITMDLERSTTRPVGEVQVLVEQDGSGT
jgi:hypothetical protein